jgi:hypothetical protein
MVVEHVIAFGPIAMLLAWFPSAEMQNYRGVDAKTATASRRPERGDFSSSPRRENALRSTTVHEGEREIRAPASSFNRPH